MTPRVLVRQAAQDDLEAIAAMLADFARGHPAHDRPRPIGSSPVAHLHLSGDGFEAPADLADLPKREIVRHLPAPVLSRRPSRSR